MNHRTYVCSLTCHFHTEILNMIIFMILILINTVNIFICLKICNWKILIWMLSIIPQISEKINMRNILKLWICILDIKEIVINLKVLLKMIKKIMVLFLYSCLRVLSRILSLIVLLMKNVLMSAKKMMVFWLLIKKTKSDIVIHFWF